jgi:glycosyltransferase involved in cell wall biosynthesis
MRVALVGDYPLDPNRISGGPQAVFAYLVQGLERFQDLELHVVAAHKALDSPRTLQRNGVTFHYLPYPNRTTFLAYPTLWQSIQHTLYQIKPDLVHGQSGYIYGTIALGSGYPTALTVHSIHGTEVRFANGWIRRLNVRLQHVLMRWYFTSRVRHVVSISPYIRQHYASEVKATFYDIDNPVSDSFFELDPEQEIPNRVLFIGFLRAVKRPDLALKAFALAREQVPELNLHFAGAAVEPLLEAQLHDFVDTNQLGQHVQFLGQLSEAQVLEAYQQMSILLLTSELETSAMAIEQAMAAGKPVVATAVGGVPFLVDDERTGLLAASNEAEQLAQAMVTLARDPELRRLMRQAARSEAFGRFKTDVVAAKTFAMYQEILKDGQG